MWLFWLIVAIIFIIAQIFNSDFFLIWFSTGALVTLLISLILSNVIIQFLTFLGLSFIFLLCFNNYCSTHFNRKNTLIMNIDDLIGQTGLVYETISGNPAEPGKVKLDGEIWSAVSCDNTTIYKGEEVIIDEIKGVRLFVHKKTSPK